MLVGPVLSRELVTGPRRPRLYLARTLAAAGLWGLLVTSWLVLTGTQDVRNVGDLARFGTLVFQILIPIELLLAICFPALSAAAAVAQEKDRRTLILLLLTRLSNSELVLGKLAASLLIVAAMLLATLPVLMALLLLGGVSPGQIARGYAVIVATALVSGSLGSTLGLWRESTFQTLAWTTLLLVGWWGLGVALNAQPGTAWLAAAVSPFPALDAVLPPTLTPQGARFWTPELTSYLLFCGTATLLINGWAILRVRVWNPSQQAHDEATPRQRQPSQAEAAVAWRPVWTNPVLWREVRTWAYGRRVVVLRLAYLVIATVAALVLHQSLATDSDRSEALLFASRAVGDTRVLIPTAAKTLVPLLGISLVLTVAMAVTTLTTERDGKTIDLLLVTDLTPREFVFGKLAGVLYNTKEMILLPLLLCGYLYWRQGISIENLAFVVIGMLVLVVFVAMLGLHAGMKHASSRTAVGVAIGTVLFLMVGVATCMRMMIAFDDSFGEQLFPFVGFLGGGGLALWVALGWPHPSHAITLTAMMAPLLTFYAITCFLLGSPGWAFLAVVVTYGFATTAMLTPAVHEFVVSHGRTSSGDE